MTIQVSVIICTHNPRANCLPRVMAALRAQTLPTEQWELLVIDNLSTPPLAGRLDLAWHPHGRCIREEELGLTPGRLRGIRESKADLIIFVDDDNVLDKDFVAKAIEVSREHPELGVWGGRVTPEFESQPPEWTKGYWGCLAIREFDRDQWASCWPLPNNVVPCGAGMVVRRVVAETYAKAVSANTLRRNLGRKGNSLMSAEDIDMAMTSRECGLGSGLFTRLHLLHLIPSSRLQPDYLERLLESIGYSTVMLHYNKGIALPSDNIYNRIYHALRGLRRHGFDRIAYYADQRGIRHALRDLRQIRKGASPQQPRESHAATSPSSATPVAPTTQKPLISFYVIACNQQKFVSDAVAAALAQTWSPLEVVLSDDCSDDDTFAIMQKMAKDYRGPHTVVLNRNEKRLGVGAHINRVLQLCHGEWIVASAGDDVSRPNRVEQLFANWIADGQRAALVYSNLVETDEYGADLHARDFRKESTGNECHWNHHARLSGHHPPVHGATFAYPRRTFDQFGPLWDGVVFEDNVLNWRAELTGGVLLCPEFLVRHRNHPGQITNLHSRHALLDADERRRLLSWSNVVSLRQNIADARLALDRGWLRPDEHTAVVEFISTKLRAEEADFALFWGDYGARWKILLGNLPGLLRRKRATQILFAILPRSLYLAALRVAAKRR